MLDLLVTNRVPHAVLHHDTMLGARFTLVLTQAARKQFGTTCPHYASHYYRGLDEIEMSPKLIAEFKRLDSNGTYVPVSLGEHGTAYEFENFKTYYHETHKRPAAPAAAV